MDARIPRIRRKLAAIPFQPHRSRSFGEERHRFRLSAPSSAARLSAFEAEYDLLLPDAYRQFLLHLGSAGAGSFYGLVDPIARTSAPIYTMDPPGKERGFGLVPAAGTDRDRFLHIAEMGCTDLALIALEGPIAGRVVIGNASGWWGPNVSSAADFLAWYERWLDHMAAGKDDRGLELTSPALRAHPGRTVWAPSCETGTDRLGPSGARGSRRRILTAKVRLEVPHLSGVR
ncbi:SMI1/KNR4 family protein [Yinghuangia soli]|uniref:SMI1/KNR4 family protein n=1 Tax=Yinghuangia soli TaxID=2908204 RepID=UPI0027E363D1|nr:SMI1/KNR4 family protein [Yinghuangia soli]